MIIRLIPSLFQGIPSQWHNDFFSKEGDKEVVVKRIKKHFSTTYFERGETVFSCLLLMIIVNVYLKMQLIHLNFIQFRQYLLNWCFFIVHCATSVSSPNSMMHDELFIQSYPDLPPPI